MAKSFQVDTNGTLTTNLLDYWKGDSLTGFYLGTVLTNNGSVGIDVAGGKVGTTFDFGASNTTKYLNILNALGMDGTTSNSFCGWVKSQTGNGANSHLIGWGSTTPNDINSTLRANSTTSLTGHRLGSTNDTVTDSFNVEDGAWHFVCFRWEGTTITVNVNARTAVTVGSTQTSGNGDVDQFIIGAHYAGTIQHWSGYICEVGIWNKALSNQEVTDLFNGGSGQTMTSGFVPKVMFI